MMKSRFLVLEILAIYSMLVFGENVRSLGINMNSPASYPSPRWRYVGEANSSNSSSPSLRIPMSHIYHRASKFRPLNCSDECVGLLLLEQAEALDQIDRTRHEPVGNFSQEKDTVQNRVSVNYLNGRHLLSHYVTVTLDYGNIAQEAELLVDSGSPMTWFQCKPCQSCFPQKRRVVDPKKSPSSRFLSGRDAYCQNLQSTPLGTGANGFNCRFKEIFGDSSFCSGNVIVAAFKFKSFDGQRDIILDNMIYGCGYINKVKFNTGLSGIFGLSTHYGLSWPSQLRNVLGASFGYCLPVVGSSPGQGWLALGSEQKPDLRVNPLYQFTNFLLVGERGFFYLDVIDFVVNNRRLNANPAVFAIRQINGRKLGGFISDSGFMITYLIPQAYVYLRAAYRQEGSRIFAGNIVPGLFGMDTCWDATNIDTSTTPVPTYGLLFRNGRYMQFSRTASFFTYISRRGRPLLCLPIQGIGATPLDANWLGGYSTMNTAMWHDMENRRLLWSPDVC